MTTYPHNAKLYRTTPGLTIATYTYKRQSGNKHILEDSNRVTVTATDQQLSAYTMSRRMALTELEEVLRIKIDRVHEELREAGIAFNPIGHATTIYIATNPIHAPVEVHQYNISTGRYLSSYRTISDAFKSLNKGDKGGQCAISYACKGKYKKAYGFKWSYEKRNFY